MVKKDVFGVFCAALANLIFGFSFIFSKAALKYGDPLIILSVRFGVAFLFMCLLLILGIIKVDYKNKPVGKLCLMAIFQPLLYFLLELYGLKLTTSALSGIILAVVPMVVLIFSAPILGERPTVMQIICTVVSLLSVSVISLIGENVGKNYFLGVVFVVGAVLCAAAFNIVNRGISNVFSPFERTFFMFLSAAVGYNVLSLAVYRAEYFTVAANLFFHTDSLISILYLGVISSCLAFFLYNFSLSGISAVKASAFSNIITVVSILAGVLILGEPFSVWQFIMCLPILLGVVGVSVYGK